MKKNWPFFLRLRAEKNLLLKFLHHHSKEQKKRNLPLFVKIDVFSLGILKTRPRYQPQFFFWANIEKSF